MANKKTLKEEVLDTTTQDFEIEVSEPVALKRELPLVVKPTGGSWANEAQAQYARTLNGYAVKNPDKWAKKKDVLIAQLKELATNPDRLFYFEGGENPNIQYTNKSLQ